MKNVFTAILTAFFLFVFSSPAFPKWDSEKWFGPNGPDYAQTVTVAKSGGDFTTITAALNSISDAATGKRYCIEVYPGTYSESVVGEPYVDLVAVGGPHATIITQANATVVALDNNELIQGFTLSLTAPTAARNVLTYPGTSGSDQANNWILDNIITFTGNYDSIGIGPDGASSMPLNGLYIDGNVITGTSTSYGYGIKVGSNAATVENVFVTNNIVKSVKYGIYAYTACADGAQPIILSQNYILGGTNSFLTYVATDSKYNVTNSYDNIFLTGSVNLSSVAATRTVTFNSYRDVIASVALAGGGGTETFTPYGSVVDSTQTNRVLTMNTAAGAAVTNIFFKDGDVGHPFTSIWSDATIFAELGVQSTTGGGFDLMGISDGDIKGLRLGGLIGASDPTDTTPAVQLYAAKSDGSNARADIGSDETAFQFINRATVIGNVYGDGDFVPAGAVGLGYESVTTSSADPGVGVASVLDLFTDVTTDATGSAADAVSLAAGRAGQLKVVKLAVDNETTGLSVTANYSGATAAVLMEDAGDFIVLVSDGTEWTILVNNGGTLS